MGYAGIWYRVVFVSCEFGMSYDISLWVPREIDILDWNYTSNCSPMWRAAGADLADFHDKLASDCIPVLSAAIDNLKANPEKFKEMNPPNKWGSYETLVPALEEMLEKFKDEPNGRISVSR